MPILAKETNKENKENMTNRLATWTTNTLVKTRKDYTSRMKDYNKREQKSWSYKNLKETTEQIIAELNRRNYLKP